LYEPSAFGFTEREMPALPDGKYIGIGASKGAKLIDGPGGPGNMNAALFMDCEQFVYICS
uniref:SGL domain-containing protein n=1 Tax=Anisakis simplex TaxID=6269 RepID=A0A0M3KJ33_ANISI